MGKHNMMAPMIEVSEDGKTAPWEKGWVKAAFTKGNW